VEGDAARRAVELALLGEPERVVSVPPRKDEDGMGLAFGGEVEGLLSSLFVNKPAMIAECARVRGCSESGVWYIGEVGGLLWSEDSPGRDNDEGQVRSLSVRLSPDCSLAPQ
jgi:hypothetical protein